MPRRRYFRRYSRVVAAKKKWASNIKQGRMNTSSGGSVLVENSTQGATPTPVIVKAGNFKIQGDLTLTGSAGYSSFTAYVIYTPEGVTTSYSDLRAAVAAHPEWVMGWSLIDVPGSASGFTGTNKFSISSRLKRNLNSGDRVVFFILAENDQDPFSVAYTAQYWTCAN